MRPAVVAGLLGGPALDLNFIAMGVSATLDPRITFVRSSNATQFDSQGRMVWAPANIEIWSQDFSNVAWVASGASTKTTGITDPLGGATACTFTSANNNEFMQSSVGSGVVGQAYTVSLWIKRRNGTGNVGLRAVNASLVYVTVTSAWTRVSASVVASSTNVRIGVGLDTAGDSVDIAFAQSEPTGVDSPKTYNATTSAAYYGPRFDYDPATLAPLGLLIEELRTNSLTFALNFSNAAWTTSTLTVGATVASPDGQTNGYTLTATGPNATIKAAVTTTAVAWTASFWLRRVTGSGNVDITMDGTTFVTQTLTSTWTRFSASQTGVAGTSNPGIRLVTSGDVVQVFGGQAEAGAFATSLIPTFGTAATRAAESPNIPTTGWMAANIGSWYASFRRDQVDLISTKYIAALDSVGRAIYQATNLGIKAYDGTNISGTANLITGGVIAKAASSVSGAGLKTCLAGGAVATTAFSGTFGTVQTTLNIGHLAGVNQLNGWIQSIKYWPTAKTDAQLQALTA